MISVSFPILGGSLAEVGTASRLLKEQLRRLGVRADAMRRVMIAAYEAEANVVIHASRGTLYARLGEARIDMEIVDQGPGIPDVARAMTEGYSTAPEEARKLGFGAGMGLPNIKKSSDRFSIQTRVGRGTRVFSTIVFGSEDEPASVAAACSPVVRAEGCVSCLACVRACPTEAIRMRSGRPIVLDHLCIGCAACIASCSHGVFGIEGATDTSVVEGEACTVLVAPAAFLGSLDRDPAEVLAGLGGSGVEEVRLLESWEAAVLDEATRLSGVSGSPRPVIPPICPAVTNLVETSFPSLIPSLVCCLSPAEAATREPGLEPVAVVAGCPAQLAAVLTEPATGRVKVLAPSRAAALARRGRGRAARLADRMREEDRASVVVRVDGMRRVLRVLIAMERGLLGDVAVLDLRACEGGCGGSPLEGGDPAVALMRLARAELEGDATAREAESLPRAQPYAARRGLRLDADMVRAMQKLRKIDEVAKSLPGRDCAVCGSPTCAGLAEDIVLGRTEERCPFVEEGGTR